MYHNVKLKSKGKMWKKELIYIFSILFCLVSFIWLCKALFLGYYPDFNTQYNVPELILSGVNPYLGGSGLYTSQVYPPSVFFVFLPFSLFSLTNASYIYTILSITSLIISLYILSKTFELNFFGTSNLLLMSLVFVSFPVKFTLGMGQINMLILLLLALFIWFVKLKKDFIAGLFLGTSIAIKLFPIFLPVYLLMKFKKGNRGLILPWTRLRLWVNKKQLKDDLEIIDGALVVIFIFAILTIIFIPKELTLHFIFETIPSLLTSWKLDYYNQALSGFIGRSFGIETFAIILKTSVSLFVTIVALYIITKNEDDSFSMAGLKFGTLITLSLILNNFSWQHHFVWMIIPFYATFYYLKKIRAKRLYLVIVGISFLLISFNFKHPEGIPVLIQSHVLYGALLLLVLNLYFLHKKKLAISKD